jgi:mevalonate kinase
MTLHETACGKVILLGEHAVVYGFPAIAIPVQALQARADWEPGPAPLRIIAPDVGLNAALTDLPDLHPLAYCVRHAAEAFGVEPPGGVLTVRSEIPIAAGLGSGAAVSTAIVRVLADAAGKRPTAADVSAIVFAIERIYHGTPSGVDNTVIAHRRPIFFRRGSEAVVLAVRRPVHFLIADSGMPGSTREAVAGVRRRHDASPALYDGLFRKIGALAESGRSDLEAGSAVRLGAALDENHELLRAIEVSTPALDRLVEAARGAGALGAKLTGGGLGGNLIALVEPERRPAVERALRDAGAVKVLATALEP